MKFTKFVSVTFFLVLLIGVLSTGIVSAIPECINNSDCDYLDDQYCENNNVMDVKGVCTFGVCELGTPTIALVCQNAWSYCVDDYVVHYFGAETCIDYGAYAACTKTDPPEEDCRDTLFCNGVETCSAGACLSGIDPCDDGDVCLDTCDEGTDQCDYDIDDNEGPSIFDLLVNPYYNNGIFDITTTVKDECSKIKTAEYFLRHSGSVDCGTPGNGTTIYPEDDRSFDLDKLVEYVKAEDVEFFEDGSNRVCVQGQDAEDNWGSCQCYYYESDTMPPELVYNIFLNNESEPNEYLICGNNPTLYVTVCDSESDIQGGEFFLNMLIPPMAVPAPWSGYWLSVLSPPGQYMSGGWQCANLSGQINQSDFDELEDGTHYINQIRGKDIVENWGKVWGQNFNYSFIKDTTAPVTVKELNPFEDDLVGCYGYEEGESNVYEKTGCQGTTNGCYYVKQGTTIELGAYDPDPQGTGEFAGNVVIHYIVWWKNNSGDSWIIDQQGQSNVDEAVTITLDKDSYHLVEYWAVDDCGWEEEHHFELDIVDSVAPVGIKTVGEPNILCSELNDTECDYWVRDHVTEITLDCVDPEPHPVSHGKMCYKISFDDPEMPYLTEQYCYAFGGWMEDDWCCADTAYLPYTFVFTEDSLHDLEYYCEDALGNRNEVDLEWFKVDSVPPETTKEYGEPIVTTNGSYPFWITSQTSITLAAVDGGDICAVGVDEIYWRNTLVDDTACWEPELYCGRNGDSQETVVLDFEELTGQGLLPLDYAGLTWDENWWYYDWNQTPYNPYSGVVRVYNNEEATPYVLFPESVTFDGAWFSGGYDRALQFYGYNDGVLVGISSMLVLTEVPTWLGAGFSGQVDRIEIHFNEGTDNFVMDDFTYTTGEGGGDWQIYTGPFYKPEESCHLIEYYSVDKLGNEESVNRQCVFVDNSAPNTTKIVGEPKYYNDTDGTDWWVTQETNITLDCNDVEPHPVGYEKMCYKMSYDDPAWLTEQYCTNFGGVMEGEWCCLNDTENPYTFHFTEDCLHDLEWYCEDKLGNREDRIEYDNVDTQAPNITKFVILENGTRVYSPTEGTVTIAINSDVILKFCADVVDYKQTGDTGVGVNSVWARFSLLDDPVLIWNEGEQAYCYERISGDCGKWHYEVKANDSLGNEAEWTNGIEIIIDNVAPIAMVLNPHAGNNYYDGKIFPVEAPAVDFGGDDFCGYNPDCPASGVKECTFYAIDFCWECVNQSEIKSIWDICEYLDQTVGNYTKVEIGTVPYVNGECQGYLQIPENSGLEGTVFMGIKVTDYAGNYINMLGWDGYLAVNPWISPITMNMQEKGSIAITSLEGFEGATTSLKSFEVGANIEDTGITGQQFCVGTIYDLEMNKIFSYAPVLAMGNPLEGYDCLINELVKPNYPELESGSYIFEVAQVYNSEVMSSDSFEFTVDNTRPTMSVVSPSEGGVYGIMFPVSLNVEDSQSSIADETVMFRIQEIPVLGNLFCIFGTCEDTRWVTLQEQANGLYANTINLTEYNITGQGRYVFDAVACDNLYVEDTGTELGFSLNNDRTDVHCRMISEHGQVFEEPRTQCNDGIDNDLDGDIDFSDDVGCESFEDDDETDVVPVCGNGDLEGDEGCDDGNNVDGDGCSSVCVVEYCGDGIVNNGEDCEFDCNCSEGFNCFGCVCLYEVVEQGNESVKINEFVSNPFEGNDWVELYNLGDDSIDLDGWKLNDSSSEIKSLSGFISSGGFTVFEVSNRLNGGGDTIKLIDNYGFIVDSVSYGIGSYDAPVPSQGNSTGRSPDGQDTDVDNADFYIFSTPTQGSTNVVP